MGKMILAALALLGVLASLHCSGLPGEKAESSQPAEKAEEGQAPAEPAPLSVEKVEAILGVPVKVEARGSGGVSYTSADPLCSLTVDPVPGQVVRMGKGSKESIPTLGDDAYYQLSMPQTVILSVVKGESGFIVSLACPMGKPAAVENLDSAAREVATLVLAGL